MVAADGGVPRYEIDSFVYIRNQKWCMLYNGKFEGNGNQVKAFHPPGTDPAAFVPAEWRRRLVAHGPELDVPSIIPPPKPFDLHSEPQYPPRKTNKAKSTRLAAVQARPAAKAEPEPTSGSGAGSSAALAMRGACVAVAVGFAVMFLRHRKV